MGRVAGSALCSLKPWENKVRVFVQPVQLGPRHRRE